MKFGGFQFDPTSTSTPPPRCFHRPEQTQHVQLFRSKIFSSPQANFSSRCFDSIHLNIFTPSFRIFSLNLGLYPSPKMFSSPWANPTHAALSFQNIFVSPSWFFNTAFGSIQPNIFTSSSEFPPFFQRICPSDFGSIQPPYLHFILSRCFHLPEHIST